MKSGAKRLGRLQALFVQLIPEHPEGKMFFAKNLFWRGSHGAIGLFQLGSPIGKLEHQVVPSTQLVVCMQSVE